MNDLGLFCHNYLIWISKIYRMEEPVPPMSYDENHRIVRQNYIRYQKYNIVVCIVCFIVIVVFFIKYYLSINNLIDTNIWWNTCVCNETNNNIKNMLDIIESENKSLITSLYKKRIIILPSCLMVNETEAHNEMYFGKIMHEEYMQNNANFDKFKRHIHYISYDIDGPSLLFNMHYMNQKYHIKFNKIFYSHEFNYCGNHCHNFTTEVENTNEMYIYKIVMRHDLATIAYEFDNILQIIPLTGHHNTVCVIQINKK